MTIQSTLHGRITKILSVCSANWPLSLIYVPFPYLELGKASSSFKEGSVVGYYNKVIEASKLTPPTSGLKLI